MNKNLERAKGITVAELKEMLEDYPDDSVVHFQYDYGDHGRSLVTPGVKNVEQVEIKYSDYHQMPRRVDDEDTRTSDDDKLMVVVLS